ncbi:MAG TPA: TetR/AcrR family transcriptional regulator [Streptosporangiaceae bacterium]
MAQHSPARRPVVTAPVQRRSRDVVARILEATGTLLNSGAGRSGITMQQVAEQAGVSVGSIYRYYADKSDLLRATQDRTLTEFDVRMAARMDEAPATVEGAVEAMVGVMHDHMRRRAREIGAFMTASDGVMVGRARATHRLKLARFRCGLERDRDRVSHDGLDLAAEVGLSIIDGLFLGYARQSARSTPSLRLDVIAGEARSATLAYLLRPAGPAEAAG